MAKKLLLYSFLFFSVFYSFSFNLKETRSLFYGSNKKDKLLLASTLRDFYLDEAPDSIYNIGNHLFNIGSQYENPFWMHYGKLLLASYYTKKGKLDFSKELLLDCIKFYERKRDKLSCADAYNLLGQAYIYESNYKKAIVILKKSLSYANELPLEDEAFMAQISLSEVYIAIEKFDLAEQEMTLFLKKVKQLNLNKAKRKAYGILARIYLSTNRKSEAIKLYEKALKLAYENGDKLGLSTAYNNYAIALFEIENFDKSLVYFQTALKLRLQINYPKTICESYFNLAEINSFLKRNTEAEMYLDSMIDLSKKHNLLQELNDALAKKIEILKKQKKENQLLSLYENLIETQKTILKKLNQEDLSIEQNIKKIKLTNQVQLAQIREKQILERLENEKQNKKYLYFIIFILSVSFLLIVYKLKKK